MMKPLLFALLVGIVPGVGRAQMFQPSLYLGPQISFQAHAAVPQSKPRQSASANDMTQRDDASMTYRSDPARRRANLAQFLAKARAVDPVGADDLAKIFAQGDIIEKIGQLGAPYGLRINNVADAYSTYWINAYQAFRGINPTPSARQINAVRDQASRSLGATAEFQDADDAAKQQMAEALWVQAAFLDVAVEQSKNDAAQREAVGKAAAQGALGMGLDFNRMRLTEQGFVPL
jgi:hypothetical protein